MTEYLEFDFSIRPEKPWTEILMAELIELGFDSFTENEGQLLGYIPKEYFHEEELKKHWLLNSSEVEIKYSFHDLPNIDWNAEWEKNFRPILIEDKVLIRSEFHPAQKVETEIVIQPKMAFGTGHHATTYLMIKQMLSMDFRDKTVLDMGCGTSILGIYAKIRGAKTVEGIDIDEWAVDNSLENIQRNQVEMSVKQGTANDLGDKTFDVILANINRNILMNDIPRYVQVLNKGGQLLLSGLCDFDEVDIMAICIAEKLSLDRRFQREEWVSLLLTK